MTPLQKAHVAAGMVAGDIRTAVKFFKCEPIGRTHVRERLELAASLLAEIQGRRLGVGGGRQ